MKILIDIGHPAHVHLFKHFAWEMQKQQHSVLFTCRNKEFEFELLKHFGFNTISFGKKYQSTISKIFGMFKFDLKMIKTALSFKPNVFLSHGSIYASHAAFLLRKPHIALEDTFNFEQIKLYKPFTKHILTSDYNHPIKSKKVIKYAGYHELAYLHPSKFKPDINVLNSLHLLPTDKYIIIRFVSWNATHDTGQKGMSLQNKIKAIHEFEKYAKVFISSEGVLPAELEQYRFPIEPYKMHDAIAYSALVFGESSTMSEEAAMLGVPSIYLNTKSTIYTKHLEHKYQLIFNFTESESDQHKAIEKAIEILKSNHCKEEWIKRRDNMLQEKIDVTSFLVWFIENYPKSATIMKQNPDYQYQFK